MAKMNGLKWIFIGLVTAAALSMAMGGLTLWHDIQERIRAQKKPTPFPPGCIAVTPTRCRVVDPPAPVVQGHPPQPPEKTTPVAWQPPVEFLGNWQGNGATNTGFFFLTMEITPNTRNPNELLAAVTTANMLLPGASRSGMAPLGQRQPSIAELMDRLPHRAKFVGTASGDGAVDFHVTQSVGAAALCPLTDIRVSTFGTQGVVAEWKGAGCPGGSIVLVKQR